jgi:hypothetical protein
MTRLTLMAAALQGLLANPEILTPTAVRKADDGWIESLLDFAERVAIRGEKRLRVAPTVGPRQVSRLLRKPRPEGG